MHSIWIVGLEGPMQSTQIRVCNLNKDWPPYERMTVYDRTYDQSSSYTYTEIGEWVDSQQIPDPPKKHEREHQREGTEPM